IRVVQPGDNVALLAEAPKQLRIVSLGPQDLYRDVLGKHVVGSPCQIDSAHAAAADLADDLVVADALAFKVGECGFVLGNGERCRYCVVFTRKAVSKKK